MILDKYVAIEPDAYNAHKLVDDVKRCINSGMTTGNCVYWEEWVGDYTLDIHSGEIVMSPYNCRHNNIEVISLTKWLSEYEKLNKNFKLTLKEQTKEIDYFGLLLEMNKNVKYIGTNKNGVIMGFDKHPIKDTKVGEYVNPIGETWTIANVESEGFNWELSLKKI